MWKNIGRAVRLLGLPVLFVLHVTQAAPIASVAWGGDPRIHATAAAGSQSSVDYLTIGVVISGSVMLDRDGDFYRFSVNKERAMVAPESWVQVALSASLVRNPRLVSSSIYKTLLNSGVATIRIADGNGAGLLAAKPGTPITGRQDVLRCAVEPQSVTKSLAIYSLGCVDPDPERMFKSEQGELVFEVVVAVVAHIGSDIERELRKKSTSEGEAGIVHVRIEK